MMKLRISVPVVGLALLALGCGDDSGNPVDSTTDPSATGSGPINPGVGPTGPSVGPSGPAVGPSGPAVGPSGPTVGPSGPAVGPSGPAVGPSGPGPITPQPTGVAPNPNPTPTGVEPGPNPDPGPGPGPEPTDEPVTPEPPALPEDGVVTSGQGAYWTPGALTEGGTAVVTLSEAEQQTWDGFGGSFNERGWSYLTTDAMKAQAIKLLFSATEGANLSWGRIPMGASDYGVERYTLADTGGDVTPNQGETNRPPVDLELNSFSLEQDKKLLIPYIKAAQAEKPDLRLWASPWTPPVWMKTGYKADSAGNNPVKPSYFDGGNMRNDPDILAALALYFEKFVQGYDAEGIKISVVAPQNEPGFEQNYPSCLWNGQTYVNFIGQHLGPRMKALNVQVMLGTLSNTNDSAIGNAVMDDATARSFVSLAGVQWGMLEQLNDNTRLDLPYWATEHKCGNYPWNPQGAPAYNSSQAPNDHRYAVDSWGFIHQAIVTGKVTSYSAWNMVLDRLGLGNDFARDWKQNALLVADGGQVNATPFYHVFRHLSQYTAPGAKVLTANGGQAIGFRNPDGSLVVVAYNSGAANPNYGISLGGKTFQVNMPASGWATVKYTP